MSHKSHCTGTWLWWTYSEMLLHIRACL